MTAISCYLLIVASLLYLMESVSPSADGLLGIGLVVIVCAIAILLSIDVFRAIGALFSRQPPPPRT